MSGHQHEGWQMRWNDNHLYCAACGALVVTVKPEEPMKPETKNLARLIANAADQFRGIKSGVPVTPQDVAAAEAHKFRIRSDPSWRDADR